MVPTRRGGFGQRRVVRPDRAPRLEALEYRLLLSFQAPLSFDSFRFDNPPFAT
jgi:hypothetical protein